MMRRLVAFVGAMVLVVGLVGVEPTSGATPEGGPPGNQFQVVYELLGPGQPTSGAITFDGSAFSPLDFDITNKPSFAYNFANTLTSTYFVSNDRGADRVSYRCSLVMAATCTADADGLDIEFPFADDGVVAVVISLRYGRCDGRVATVFLSEGETPTAGNDVILGTNGANTINGLGGNDRICGLGGHDILRGGNGLDRVLGGNGNDRLEGGNSADTLLGQAGNDTLLGQAGNDSLNGGTQTDSCNGGPGGDSAVGCEVRTGFP